MNINLVEYNQAPTRTRQKGMFLFRDLFPWCFESENLVAKCGVALVPCFVEDGSHSIFWFGPKSALKTQHAQWNADLSKIHTPSIIAQQLEGHIDQIRILLNEQIPYVVDTIPNLRQDFCFVWVDGMQKDNARIPKYRISGRSASLSVFLAAISWLIQKPIPLNIICSADIDSYGNLSCVGKMEPKLQAINTLTKTIDTLLVAKGQEIPKATGNIQVKEFTSIKEVLNSDAILIEGKTLWMHLSALFLQPTAVPNLIQSVIVGRSFFNSWDAILTTAKERLRTEQDPVQQDACRFLIHVASRFSGKNFEPFSIEWVLQQPRAMRYNLIAHVEQAKVANILAPARTDFFGLCVGHERYEEDIKELLIPPTNDADIIESQPVLKLWGAKGRILIAESMTMSASTDQEQKLQEAYQWTWGAIQGWLNLLLPAEASYSLCALYRIATIFMVFDEERAQKMLAQAEDILEKVENFLTDSSLMYVQVARGEAYIWFGKEEEGASMLAELLSQQGWHQHPHVRGMAVRSLLLLSDSTKQPEQEKIQQTTNEWWQEVIAQRANADIMHTIHEKYPKIQCNVDYFLRAFFP